MTSNDVKEFIRIFKSTFENSPDNSYIIFNGEDAVSEFRRNAWNYYVDNGLITAQEVELEQETYFEGYPTEKGKKLLTE
jgi:hypothetical protein